MINPFTSVKIYLNPTQIVGRNVGRKYMNIKNTNPKKSLKPKGKHLNKVLTAALVRSTKKPGFYSDGNGLYLKVDKNGAKRWIQRIVINKKRCDLGLGSASVVSLKEARELAYDNKKLIHAGGDPLAEKRKASAILSFQDSAKKVHELHLPTWSNEKQGKQWINTLTTYAFPVIGRKKIDKITSSDVLTVLMPIWNEKPETAKRVKQRIGTVLKWAIAQGWRNDNPAQSIDSALPKGNKVVKHHKSLPYKDVGNAIERIKKSDATNTTKLALEILILTALRSGEVRNAKWNEVNLENKIWTIPSERMKKRKEHNVPLSPRCIEIFEEALKLNNDVNESDFIFTNQTTDKPLSDVTLSKLVRELKINCVPHGFRSSFRIWASEQTNIPREVCEFALAHVVGDAAEQAYQRSDLFDKRRKLMEMWSQYLSLKNKPEDSNIIKLA